VLISVSAHAGLALQAERTPLMNARTAGARCRRCLGPPWLQCGSQRRCAVGPCSAL
jgi:hypothetical protein